MPSKKLKAIIPMPCVKEVNYWLDQWKTSLTNAKYRAQEAAINLILKQYPNNNRIDEVLVKACCINDFYSTSIFSIYPVAAQILKIKDIDKRLKDGDKTLVKDIATCNPPRENYSFATKYCSHHNPNFPLFDKYVKGMLVEVNKTHSFASFTQTALHNYETFYNVIQEFIKHFGLTKFTLKEIDIYLWLAGKHYL